MDLLCVHIRGRKREAISWCENPHGVTCSKSCCEVPCSWCWGLLSLGSWEAHVQLYSQVSSVSLRKVCVAFCVWQWAEGMLQGLGDTCVLIDLWGKVCGFPLVEDLAALCASLLH